MRIGAVEPGMKFRGAVQIGARPEDAERARAADHMLGDRLGRLAGVVNEVRGDGDPRVDGVLRGDGAAPSLRHPHLVRPQAGLGLSTGSGGFGGMGSRTRARQRRRSRWRLPEDQTGVMVRARLSGCLAMFRHRDENLTELSGTPYASRGRFLCYVVRLSSEQRWSSSLCRRRLSQEVPSLWDLLTFVVFQPEDALGACAAERFWTPSDTIGSDRE